MSKIIAEGWSVVVDRPDGTSFALKGHGGIDDSDGFYTRGMVFESREQAEACRDAAILNCFPPCRVAYVRVVECPDEAAGAKP